MDWLRTIGDAGLLGIPAAWLPFAGFWLLLFILVGAELARPLHAWPPESRGRLIANFGLGIVNAAILATLPVSTVLAAEWARVAGFGALHRIVLPPLAAFVATLAIWSLAIYALHVLAHRVPLLWRIHRVHHCDAAIDLSTGLRHHPAEAVYVALALSGLAVLLGLDGAAIAAYALVAAGFALWTHSNVRLPERADRILRLVLVTPAAHHIHHTSARSETDSNYGDVLLLWDRLFGTYRPITQAALVRLRFGLGADHDAGAGNLLVQLRLPLRRPPRATAAPPADAAAA